MYGDNVPDPSQIDSLEYLVKEIAKLRRRAARQGQVQLSVRDIAARTGKAPSTLDPYLRGRRLCPVDTYEAILRALGVVPGQLRPWLDAWERIADALPPRSTTAHPRDWQSPSVLPVDRRGSSDEGARRAQLNVPARRRPHILTYSERFLYRLVPQKRNAPGRVGIIAGDLRRIKCAEVWVNSENTYMRMSRFEEYSVSAIIRFDGAFHDDAGRVTDDRIADELARKVAGRCPVAPGMAITTGAGELMKSNGVRYIIHVAAAHGEPGGGYSQILDVGRCVTNALVEAERLGADEEPVRTILFPILGTGVAGGELEPTVRALLGAAVDHLATARPGRIRIVYFLASEESELNVCRAVFDASPRLSRTDKGADRLPSVPR